MLYCASSAGCMLSGYLLLVRVLASVSPSTSFQSPVSDLPYQALSWLSARLISAEVCVIRTLDLILHISWIVEDWRALRLDIQVFFISFFV